MSRLRDIDTLLQEVACIARSPLFDIERRVDLLTRQVAESDGSDRSLLNEMLSAKRDLAILRRSVIEDMEPGGRLKKLAGGVLYGEKRSVNEKQTRRLYDKAEGRAYDRSQRAKRMRRDRRERNKQRKREREERGERV